MQNVKAAFSRDNGFTLVELMVVVAIIAILASIGYPSYQEQIRKGARTECQGFLLDLANRQERFYSQNVSYGSLSDLGFAAGDTSSEGNCAIKSITLLPSGCKPGATSCRRYTLTAAPVRSDPNCTTFSYSSDNVKASTGAYTDYKQCWR